MLSKHPAVHIFYWLSVIELLKSFDATDDHPDDGKQEDEVADHYTKSKKTDTGIEQSDPERSDLKLVMRLQPLLRTVSVDVSHDDSDYAADTDERADHQKYIDDFGRGYRVVLAGIVLAGIVHVLITQSVYSRFRFVSGQLKLK